MLVGVDDGDLGGGVVLAGIVVVDEEAVVVVCVVGDEEMNGFGGKRVGILVRARYAGFICFGSDDRSKSWRTYLSDVRLGLVLVMMGLLRISGCELTT